MSGIGGDGFMKVVIVNWREFRRTPPSHRGVHPLLVISETTGEKNNGVGMSKIPHDQSSKALAQQNTKRRLF